MSAIQFLLKLSWRSSVQVVDISMALRLRNPHDQDHYGGLEANDALAERAGICKGTRVVDFCAGLGGPSRYLAHRYGADVTGIELTPARVDGAKELTLLVG